MIKRVLAVILCVVICLCAFGCTGEETTLKKFYDKVSGNKLLLDLLVEKVYSDGRELFGSDGFGGSIQDAMRSAQSDRADDIKEIKAADNEIVEIFRSVRKSKYSELTKKVMDAYSAYLEAVTDVSETFESYLDVTRSLKKELERLLRELSYEL